MTIMNLKLAATCLESCIVANIPAFLWGPPGVGKSETVKQVAKGLGWNLIDFRLSLRDPVDLRGLPLVDAKTGTTRWLAPAELPDAKRDGPRGILFLDEANIASQAMQGAAMGLVLDRRLGEYHLPGGWVPVAAGNRMADRAAAQRMPTALRNRFAHFEVSVDLDAWTEWANKAGIEPLVLAFIRFRPAHLFRMPTGDENSFPTPRAWEKVSRIVGAGCDPAILHHMLSALVGEGPAAEFVGFSKVWSRLPSIAQIMSDPGSVHVPGMDEPVLLYALCSALSRRATKESLTNIMAYLRRLPKEFEVWAVVDAMRREPALTKTKAFAQWAVANQEVVI